MKHIIPLARASAKIIEVFHWAGASLMLAATVCVLAAPTWVQRFFEADARACCGAELQVYGFELLVPMVNGSMDTRALLLFCVVAVMLLSLMAMVFRDLHRIIKNVEAGTPFQEDSIRMLQEIGMFSIAIPVIGLVMRAVCGLVLGVDHVEASISAYGFLMGLLVLALTQCFLRGAELEADVDGLL